MTSSRYSQQHSSELRNYLPLELESGKFTIRRPQLTVGNRNEGEGTVLSPNSPTEIPPLLKTYFYHSMHPQRAGPCLRSPPCLLPFASLYTSSPLDRELSKDSEWVCFLTPVSYATPHKALHVVHSQRVLSGKLSKLLSVGHSVVSTGRMCELQ